MNARTLGLLCVVFALATGCVLPDYEIGSAAGSSTSADKKDAGKDPSAEQQRPASQELLAGADEACASCVMDRCQTERSECGSDCAKLKWPVSPLWKVTDQTDGFIKCLAMQCQDECQVNWGCNQNYLLPEPTDEVFPFTIRVTDAVRQGYGIERVRVRACQGLDPSCADNVGFVSEGVTDATGRATLALTRNFDGYFLLEAAKDQQDKASYLPMTVKWSEQLFRVESELTASMFAPSLVTALGSMVEEIQAGKGNFIFKAQNCLPEVYVGQQGSNASAEGVVVTYTAIGKASRVYYVTGGFQIDANLTATSLAGGGFGGVFNAPPGPVSVTGAHEKVAVSTGGFPMRADSMGAIFLLPKAKR